jgi:hypothetical protein
MNAPQIIMSIVAILLFSAIFILMQDEIKVAKRNADRYRAYCKKLIDENDSLLNHKPQETMKTLDQLIAETKGKFFSVTFTKKDGSVRTINGKDKYRRLLAGGTNRVEGLGYVSFVNRNAAGVKTPAKGNWACAHKQEVLTFKCGSIKAEFVKA